MRTCQWWDRPSCQPLGGKAWHGPICGTALADQGVEQRLADQGVERLLADQGGGTALADQVVELHMAGQVVELRMADQAVVQGLQVGNQKNRREVAGREISSHP